ncbi:MAG: hypothetical protein GY782_04755 [Gammaproteobacteria bacterium]|nr:hypothetical protein [Gammaproteobacteria bacterium]
MNLELEDFVFKAIKGIVSGAAKAATEINTEHDFPIGGYVGSELNNATRMHRKDDDRIRFDVSVSYSASKKDETSGSIEGEVKIYVAQGSIDCSLTSEKKERSLL